MNKPLSHYGWDDPSILISDERALLTWIIDELCKFGESAVITAKLKFKILSFCDACRTRTVFNFFPSHEYIENQLAKPAEKLNELCGEYLLPFLRELGSYQKFERNGRALRIEDVLYVFTVNFGRYLLTPIQVFIVEGGMMIGNNFDQEQPLPPAVFINVLLAHRFEQSKRFVRLENNWTP